MDRIKIKNKAKELTGIHLGTFWKLMIYIIVITLLISMFGRAISFEDDNILSVIISFITQLATVPLTVGVYWCLLCIIRTGKYSYSDLFKFFKYTWFIVLLQFLVIIFTWAWMILFIIPGIIASISYAQSLYVFADGETSPMKCIRKSKSLMFGHKWNYFIFNLSFIGWFLLGAFTCGILYIWILPYYQFSLSIYYDELTKLHQKKLTNE